MRVLKISVDKWLETHQPNEWTDAHDRQFNKSRELFDADGVTGFRGYEISIGEIKLLFRTLANANNFKATLITELPLLEDTIEIRLTAAIKDTIRYPLVTTFGRDGD